jgi:hypothetical protein
MRRPIASALALVLAVPFAGCAGEEAADYQLEGTYTEEASEDEMSELETEVREAGGEAFRLESFPVQFRAETLTVEDCGDVRSFAQQADYVREVGDCQLAEDAPDGDEPASNES